MISWVTVKNSLMVPVVFLLNLVIWGCAIPFFSVFSSPDYFSLLTRGLPLLFLKEFLHHLVTFLPLSIALALLGVFVFLMRHPSVAILSLGLAVGVVVVSVLFIVPLSRTLLPSTLYPLSGAGSSDSPVFESGVIRPNGQGGRILWLSVQGDSGRVGPVIVAPGTTTAIGDMLQVIPEAMVDSVDGSLIQGDTVLLSRARGLDTLVSSWFSRPMVIARLQDSALAVMNGFSALIRDGFITYLVGAAAFYFTVFSLWVICFSTAWRLLNILLLYSGFIFCCVLWPVLEQDRVTMLLLSVMPSWLGRSAYVPLVYASFSLLVLMVALGVFIARLVRRRARGVSYG
ncbi:MAG: hypothetical protein JW875_05455 [Spirochaetales bacterium]|nr:hypothetical protein [Spirochaetales bacterium]